MRNVNLRITRTLTSSTDGFILTMRNVNLDKNDKAIFNGRAFYINYEECKSFRLAFNFINNRVLY